MTLTRKSMLFKICRLPKDRPYFMLIIILNIVYLNFYLYNKKSQNNPSAVTSLGWALAILQISYFLLIFVLYDFVILFIFLKFLNFKLSVSLLIASLHLYNCD